MVFRTPAYWPVGRFVTFEEVTHNSLDHALRDTGILLRTEEVKDLLAAHDNMAAFPDVEPGLDQLARAEDIKPVIFTNGTSDMVSRSVLRSGPLSRHAETFKDLISVNDIQKFKPAPEVYNYLAQRVGKAPSEVNHIWLISSNPFDVAGALNVGMKVIWIDRPGLGWSDRVAPELKPTATVKSLREILDVIRDCT
ncbi:HAD-like domain-containing protein [Aspergillus avenaceus]|uniref:HAD-like domain-containing protein n=1 Tax=Aspergillus avenaceus TaxID=36643 RepID=A0A5N6TV30_ASPAV|nr:HAD-like domain-containing protein [Aspergillus avenaceus]